MPTEVFAFDINIANQNFQTNTANSNSGSSSQTEPGLFESIISEYTQVSQEEINSQVPEADSGEPIVNVFPQPILNIIAPINDDVSQTENHVMQIPEFLENLQNFTPEQIDTIREIFAPENLEQIVNSLLNNAELSEELQSKLELLPQDFVQKIQDVIKSLADRFIVDDAEESLEVAIQHLAHGFGRTVNELMDANGFARPEISDESEAEPESESGSEAGSEIRSKKRAKNSDSDSETISSDAAIAISGNFPVQPNESQNIISDANTKSDRSITNTNQDINSKPDAKSELRNNAIADQNAALGNANPSEIPENDDNSNIAQKNFREVLASRISERQGNIEAEAGSESEAESESESESEDFQNQNNRENQNFFGANNSRNRNVNNSRRFNDDTRQNSRVNSRSESVRNDFQNFFDGVLNNRRTLSTSQAQPLDLRTNLNLSRSESLSNGIVNVVRFIRADGLHKANIVIDPPALGRITIELTSTSSGVEASVKVNSEQIRQLIQDQISQLRMNLSRQGVQVTEFTVDVQQENANQQNSQQQQQHRFFSQANFVNDDDLDPESEDFRIDLEQGLLYWVA